MYNVPLRCICVTNVAMEKQQELHILSVSLRLSYPACDAQAPYCQLWPVWLYSIFPHYIINGRIFKQKSVTEHKMCYFDFLYNVVVLTVINKQLYFTYAQQDGQYQIYNFCLKHFSF